MRGEPTDFWGKVRPRETDGPALEWLPLVHHCADVAAVASALLSLPLWRKRLSRLAGIDLDARSCARLTVLAALHDLGKFNLGFQAKGRRDLALPSTAGHVKEGLAAVFRPEGLLKVVEPLGDWGDGATGLLVASLAHHGKPYSLESVGAAWQKVWWTPKGGLDPLAGALSLLSRCRAWCPEAFESGATPLPDVPRFAHGFAGLVTLADWLGSDERFFPFGCLPPAGDRWSQSREEAFKAMRELSLSVPLEDRRDRDGRNAFARVAPPEARSPRPAQASVLDLEVEDHPSITILESETGSGKTEAALSRFLMLFEAGLVDGMYFALPTRSAATQLHGRICAATRQAFADPPAVVLAVPGYFRVDDIEGRRVKPFQVEWRADGLERNPRGWAAETSKRYLAGCIVVGTIDQVLLSSLMVAHAHLRATPLLRHLLVVDEVHASDAYMARILAEVLRRHLDAGGHAMLLSATLGAEMRTRLLEPRSRSLRPSLEASVATPYPLVTYRARATIPKVAAAKDERAVAVSPRPWLEAPEAIADWALSQASHGATVLVIRNTVNDCVATQIAVEALARERDLEGLLFRCHNAAAPHHARFARVDRELLDNALEAALHRDRPAQGRVVVATQTVQQSLDIDADVLLSDLCPADVLLQRFGRVHRHSRIRPKGFETPAALIAVPKIRDLGVLLNERGQAGNYHGFGRVYPDLRILEATWRLVETEPVWRTPTMSRSIVERAIHSDVLSLIATSLGARWHDHQNLMVGETLGHQRLAALNIVDWNEPYESMTFPAAVDQRITTRLGDGDRQVSFQTPVPGPFGAVVDNLLLRSWWVTGMDPQLSSAEDVASDTGIVRFSFGGRRFVYDRLGVRPDVDFSEEVEHDDGP